MENENAVDFDFGTFEGFNFRDQSAIDRILSTQEVLEWDHDAQGEAEFWPSGDKPEVQMVFRSQTAVTASELVLLSNLLTDLGGEGIENYIKIVACLDSTELVGMTAEGIEEKNLHIFYGASFLDLRKEAAYELFELYYPEEYAVWKKSLCDGLTFDVEDFLGSPNFSVSELKIGDQKILVVEPY